MIRPERIVDFAADGVVEGIAEQKEEFVSLLNRKKIALGEEDTFAERITQLNSEIAYLQKAKQKEKGVSIDAPAQDISAKRWMDTNQS